MADTDVAVIGAGMAGLRCATALLAAGLHVTVLEAADRPGGRVRTDLIDGFRCDRGFQVLNPSYPAVRRELDVAALDVRPFDAGLLVRAANDIRVIADPVRAPRYAWATLRSGLLDPGDLAAFARWLAPVFASPKRTLGDPDTALCAALDSLGADGNLRRIFDRFIAGVLVDSHGQTSANFTRILVRSFALGRPGLPAAGMGAIAEQLATRLPDVRYEHRVEGLERAGQLWRIHHSNSSIQARAVVVATDAGQACELTGAPSRAEHGLTTWWYAADQAPLPDRLLLVDGRRGATPAGPVWNTAVVSNVAATYAPPGRHLIQATTLLDRPDGDAPEQAVRAHLADLYRCDTSTWTVVTRHRITHAVPAEPAPLAVARPVRVGDGLFVCGDHVDTASLQGALVSGERAARAVIGAA